MRPSVDEYMMGHALLAATRGTCARRRVGCILTNKFNHIIGTGYNGPPRGMVHCFDEPCPGATAPSGTNLDLCMATHAEQNALLQCKDVETIVKCYCTTAPCITCTKLLLNTGCQEVVYLQDYPHSESRVLWEKAGRKWRIFSLLEQVTLQGLFADLAQTPQLVVPM